MNNSLIESTLAGVCDALTLPGSTIHETSRKGQRNSVFMASKVFELEKRDSPRTCTDGNFGFYDSLWKPFRLDFQAGLSMEELLVWWRCPESRRNAKAIKWTFAMSRQTSWETYFYALFSSAFARPSKQTNKHVPVSKPPNVLCMHTFGTSWWVSFQTPERKYVENYSLNVFHGSRVVIMCIWYSLLNASTYFRRHKILCRICQ